MSAQQPARPQTGHLSIDDLEAALALLSSEASLAGDDRRKIIITSISDIAVGFVIYCFLAGLITIGFNLRLGIWLIVSSFVAMIVVAFAVSSPDEVSNTTKKIRSAIKGSEVDEAAAKGWQSREDSGCVITFVLGIFFLSLAVLGYAAYARREQWVIGSLAVGMLSAIAAGIYITVSDYREFQYFSRISKLREDFQSRLTKRGSDEDVVVSPKEQELLSQVEQQQVNRNVAKALESFNKTPKTFYSIALASEVLDELGTLAEEKRYKLRELIDSFQLEPRPQNARHVLSSEATSGAIQQFEVASGGYQIQYAVNDEKQRIDVMDLRPLNREEVHDAS